MEPFTTDADKTRQKIELAQQLSKEYFAICFWHCDPNDVITEASIPLIVKGSAS
jgi:hypothetical protein